MPEAIPEKRAERRRFPTWMIGAVLAVVLLYLALRGVDWCGVGRTISGARPEWLLAALALGLAAGSLRALRWRILLNAASEKPVGFLSVFGALMAGYLGNLVLPARAGEVVRSLLISNRSGLSKTYVITTALGERVMDAIALVLFSALALLGVPEKPVWIAGVARSMAAAAVVAAAGVAGLPYIHRYIERFVPRVLRGLLEQVVLGLRAFHHPARLAGFIALTVVIWTTEVFVAMSTARAIGLDLSFSATLLFISAMGLSSALPSAPGYVGIYQFVAITVLGPFGIAKDAAVAYVFLLQAITSAIFITCGVPGLMQSRKQSAQTP